MALAALLFILGTVVSGQVSVAYPRPGVLLDEQKCQGAVFPGMEKSGPQALGACQGAGQEGDPLAPLFQHHVAPSTPSIGTSVFSGWLCVAAFPFPLGPH